MNNIEDSLEVARQPGALTCGECQEEMFSPMDKLSIILYGKCPLHLEDDSKEVTNLFTIAELI